MLLKLMLDTSLSLLQNSTPTPLGDLGVKVMDNGH